MAGNFRGIQFSRKAHLQRFCDLIFADGRSRVAPPTISVRLHRLLLLAACTTMATPPVIACAHVRLGVFFFSWIFHFRGSPVNHENRENWLPRKFPAIRYVCVGGWDGEKEGSTQSMRRKMSSPPPNVFYQKRGGLLKFKRNSIELIHLR